MKSLALPLLLTALLAGPARAQDAAAAAKAIGKTYAAVEAKLKDSTHARWEIAHMEEEFTHKCDIWIAPEGHPLKVSDDIAGMDIRRLTEYVFDGEALVFVLLREEKGHGASITVHEDRLYFAKGKLFHYLAKEANFKSGAKLDVSAVKNAPQKIAADDDSFAQRTREAQQIVRALLAGPLAEGDAAPQPDAPGESDPPAAAALPDGPAEKYSTLIADSASPDGRYAFGWGLLNTAQGATASAADGDQDTEGVVNYLVDTKAGRLLALTAGKHFGAKASYNHWIHSAAWAPDSSLVIQTVEMKWATLSSEAWKISDGQATKLGDVLAGVRAAVETKLAKAGGAAWQQHQEDYSFSLSAPAVTADGTITCETFHQVPKGVEPGFHCKVTGSFDAAGNFKAAKITIEKE